MHEDVKGQTMGQDTPPKYCNHVVKMCASTHFGRSLESWHGLTYPRKRSVQSTHQTCSQATWGPSGGIKGRFDCTRAYKAKLEGPAHDHIGSCDTTVRKTFELLGTVFPNRFQKTKTSMMLGMNRVPFLHCLQWICDRAGHNGCLGRIGMQDDNTWSMRTFRWRLYFLRERYQCCQHQVLDIAFIHSTGHHQPVVGIRFHLSHLGSSLSLFLQSSPCFQPWMAPTRDSRDGSQEYEHTIQQGHTATLGGTQNLSNRDWHELQYSPPKSDVANQWTRASACPHCFHQDTSTTFYQYDSICIIDSWTVCQDTGFGSNFTTAERTSQRSSQKVIKEPEKEARCKRLTAHCCSQPCCLSHHHSHAQAKWCVQPALQGQVQETGAGADHQYKSSVGFLTTHPP